MASWPVKAFSVLAFHETKSVATGQRTENNCLASSAEALVRAWRPYGMASEIAYSNTDGFLFVWFCEGHCLRPPLPTTLHELKTRIREVVQTLIRKFSTTCGTRLNIGLMLIEQTSGTHTELS
jgi:hypothetical protein